MGRVPNSVVPYPFTFRRFNLLTAEHLLASSLYITADSSISRTVLNFRLSIRNSLQWDHGRRKRGGGEDGVRDVRQKSAPLRRVVP